MQIKRASYLLTAVKASQYPDVQLPAVTFCGRSNVGKSSLINTVLNRKNLARTSSQPGKTRTINFYDVDGTWYLVDLPGYGFAKVAKSERENWRYMIEEFMHGYRGGTLFVQLVDIRHEPSALDKQMWAWLQAAGVSSLLVATKSDKISRGARDKHLTVIAKALGAKKSEIIPFSSLNRDGKEPLLAKIEEYLQEIGENAENPDEVQNDGGENL